MKRLVLLLILCVFFGCDKGSYSKDEYLKWIDRAEKTNPFHIGEVVHFKGTPQLDMVVTDSTVHPSPYIMKEKDIIRQYKCRYFLSPYMKDQTGHLFGSASSKDIAWHEKWFKYYELEHHK